MSDLFDTDQPFEDSEYFDEEGYDFEADVEIEVGIKCNACFGSGLDRYEDVDCMTCYGYGVLYDD